jgi:hypothetical protein
MILSSFFLWLAVKRLKLVISLWLRIILVASFLMVGGINFSYISGRYDIIGILLCLIIFFLFSIDNVKTRLCFITLVGFLFPSSGLSSVVFSILFLSILLVFNYSLFWKEFIALVVGISCGLLFLYLLYSSNGVWNDFVNMSFVHSTMAQSSDKNNWINTIINKTQKLFDKTDYICYGCLNNKSSWPALSLLTLIIFFYELLTRSLKLCSSSTLGLAVAILIPFFMCVLGKYPFYYSWMSIVPMLVCIFHSIDTLMRNKTFYGFRKILIYLIFAILLVRANYLGLPSAIILTSQQWDNRDYEQVQNFINKNIKNDDVVYADFSTFYAIKEKIKKVYFPIYYNKMKNEEIDKLSAIIIDPREEARAEWNHGLSDIVKDKESQWYETEESLDTKIYTLKLYRNNIH